MKFTTVKTSVAWFHLSLNSPPPGYAERCSPTILNPALTLLILRSQEYELASQKTNTELEEEASQPGMSQSNIVSGQSDNLPRACRDHQHLFLKSKAPKPGCAELRLSFVLLSFVPYLFSYLVLPFFLSLTLSLSHSLSLSIYIYIHAHTHPMLYYV